MTDQSTTLSGVVQAGFARFAPRPALILERSVVSFEQLERRATEIRRLLAGSGSGTGTGSGSAGKPLIAICIERSVDLYAAISASLLSGGAYMPLSPADPDARLRGMVDRARPTAILTTAALRDRFSAASAPVFAVDEDEDKDELPAEERRFPVLPAETAPRDPAYVIFTSGSTGEPKGAVVSNRAIMNRLVWMAQALKIGPDDVLIQKTPITFDVSVWEVFLPFLTGAPLVIPNPGGHRDVAYLGKLVEEKQVTVIHFVPSAFQHFLLLESLEHQARSVRTIVASGEALSIESRDLCRERLPNARLYNLYGPTEAAVDVTWWECSPDDPYQTVPIGRAIDNVDLYVLDDDGRPVAPGERGELYIGEIAVGDGYLNDPVRTAERFVADTVSGVPGRRMYRTGDTVMRDAHGVIEFIGRRDFQVKIRGNRVELGEVESALRSSGAAQECLTVTARDPNGDTVIAAYVVAPVGRPFDEAGCKEALRTIVPEYMIPSVFVPLDALPLSEHGKVDRQRLPPPYGTKSQAPVARPGVPASSDPLTLLRQIWCEVLGRDEVTVDVNFFDAGGTSLSILRLPGLIKERIGVEVSVVDLFARPTIRALSELVRDLRA